MAQFETIYSTPELKAALTAICENIERFIDVSGLVQHDCDHGGDDIETRYTLQNINEVDCDSEMLESIMQVYDDISYFIRRPRVDYYAPDEY